MVAFSCVGLPNIVLELLPGVRPLVDENLLVPKPRGRRNTHTHTHTHSSEEGMGQQGSVRLRGSRTLGRKHRPGGREIPHGFMVSTFRLEVWFRRPKSQISFWVRSTEDSELEALAEKHEKSYTGEFFVLRVRVCLWSHRRPTDHRSCRHECCPQTTSSRGASAAP